MISTCVSKGVPCMLDLDRARARVRMRNAVILRCVLMSLVSCFSLARIADVPRVRFFYSLSVRFSRRDQIKNEKILPLFFIASDYFASILQEFSRKGFQSGFPVQ